ncbi:MAG: hypothetical protein KatS3mg060_1142 [Dehalococcoidia bacterium]|nr:MAG: hypothetical protein KatS3mg060_1142 [Dehalococcoidia bacterium]
MTIIWYAVSDVGDLLLPAGRLMRLEEDGYILLLENDIMESFNNAGGIALPPTAEGRDVADRLLADAAAGMTLAQLADRREPGHRAPEPLQQAARRHAAEWLAAAAELLRQPEERAAMARIGALAYWASCRTVSTAMLPLRRYAPPALSDDATAGTEYRWWLVEVCHYATVLLPPRLPHWRPTVIVEWLVTVAMP